MALDRASMGLDKDLDRVPMGPDGPRHCLDKNLDKASKGRWAPIGPRWPSIEASLRLDGPQ